MIRMQVEVILVPYEVEHQDSPMARAPERLVEMGLSERLEEDGHRVTVSPVWSRATSTRQAILASVARETARTVARARSRRRFPLVLAGGCLTAVGVVLGLQRLGRQIGVLWLDAHGDFNTYESSPTGYWDGMALGAVCGRSLADIYRSVELRGLSARGVVHVGGRAFDPPEVQDFDRLNLLRVTPTKTAAQNSLEAIQHIFQRRRLYYHFDLDGLDPADAPAINFPEPSGVRIDDLLKLIGGTKPASAMTLSGMNFDRVDDAGAQVMLNNIHRLVHATLERGTA